MEYLDIALDDEKLKNFLSLDTKRELYPIDEIEWRSIALFLNRGVSAYGLKVRTLYQALRLFNDYLFFNPPNRKLAAFSCLYLASESSNKDKTEDVNIWTQHIFFNVSHTLLIETVTDIIRCLQGRIRTPSIFDILSYLKYEVVQIRPNAKDIILLSFIYYQKYIIIDSIALCKDVISFIHYDDCDLYFDLCMVWNKIHPSLRKITSRIERPVKYIQYSLPKIRDNVLKERNEIICDYDYGYELGKGTYSTVRIAIKNNDIVAVKTQDHHPVSYMELALYSVLTHENLLRMKSFTIDVHCINIDLECGITLSQFIHKKKETAKRWFEVYSSGKSLSYHISLCKKQSIAMDILRGINYLHSHGILHRDIKPDNIILVNGVAKITDLGLGYFGCISENDKSYKGFSVYSLQYRCPEIIFRIENRYSFEPDVWATGVTLLELYSGITPFYVPKGYRTSEEQIENVCISMAAILGAPLQNMYPVFPQTKYHFGLRAVRSRKIREAISEMLSYIPSTRPSISDTIKFIS